MKRSPSDENEPTGVSGGSLAWIPVTKRVPAVGENVLWLVDEYGGFHHTIGCMAGDKFFSDEGIQYWITEHTYWMPLPAPPADAK